MADNIIEQLSIEISSDVNKANEGIEKLKGTLNSLKSVYDDAGKGNADVRSDLKSLSDGVNNITGINSAKLNEATSAIKYTYLRSSPRAISTAQLNTLLHLHMRPINLIVYQGSYFTRNGIPYLEGGFALRCLQCLSRPDMATRLCHWRDNRCTRGPSVPVLSY